MRKSYFWFTLVELIVSISILAILWGIAFVSFIGYTERSRDWVRVSDLESITKLLELYKIDNWSFPIPTNWVPVTYSWAAIWVQWTFWEDILSKIKNKWAELKDPSTGTEYSYSLLNTLDEYQLWTIFESDLLSDSINLESYANGSNLAYAYLEWNFNGIWARTYTWGLNYIFALPSITASYLWTDWDIVDILSNNWLSYPDWNNLPFSYKNTKFNVMWWYSSIAWIEANKLEVYTTNNLAVLTSTDISSETERITLLSEIQNSYSWALNSWDSTLKEALVTPVTPVTQETKDVAIKVVNKLLSSSIISNTDLFALNEFSWDTFVTDENLPPPPQNNINPNYVITFQEPEWQTYSCPTCQ